MRFPVHFTRVKPAAAPAITLGSETSPPAKAPSPSSMDNLLTCKVTSTSGFPVQRIAVGYKTTAAAPIALPFEVWIWDDPTSAWYLLTSGNLVAPVAANNGTITKVAVMAGADLAALGANTQASVGALDAWVFIKDPGAAPNGTYDFIVAPDLATF